MIIECKDPVCTKNNWAEITDKIKEKKNDKDDEGIIVKTILINKLTVKITGMGISGKVKKKLTIDSITLNDINSKEGFPTKQLIVAIFQSAKMKDYLKGILDYKSFFNEILFPFNKPNKDLEKKEHPKK